MGALHRQGWHGHRCLPVPVSPLRDGGLPQASQVRLTERGSFDEEYTTDWSKWVLDNGLVALPGTVRIGESVPVARWAGPRCGAVLHVQRSWSYEHGNDFLVSEVQLLDRVPGGWRVYGSQSGTDWFDPPLARPRLAPEFVGFSGAATAREDGRSCRAVDGIADVAAALIEVIDDQGALLQEPLDSSLGVFVVAVDGCSDAVVRIKDQTGRVLAVTEIRRDG